MLDRREVARGIAEAEGYLLCQSELADARAEAETFADRMPWLTDDQRAEVVRLYAADRVALSRRYLHRVVARCHELRQEYTDRYEQLRRRLLCGVLAAGATAATAYVFLLSRLLPGG